MPPPPSRRSGVGGGRSEGDRSASGRARSPQPGPLGLGSGERSVLRDGRSHSEFHGRSSPALSDAAEDDRGSISGSVDLDRDDSFRSVLRLIREFHSLKELASVAPNRCKKSLAPIYGLQSELFRLFTCPFPLCCGHSLSTRLWLCPSSWKADRPQVSPCSRSSPSEVAYYWTSSSSTWSVFSPARSGPTHPRVGE